MLFPECFPWLLAGARACSLAALGRAKHLDLLENFG
jgi:hypothetical protein